MPLPAEAGPALADLRLADDGAQLHAGSVTDLQDKIEAALAGLQSDRPGIRLTDRPSLAMMLRATGPIGAIAAAALGPGCHPVRAILFNKTAAQNWPLGWHQDRTICVAERREAPGFGPWSVKHGLQHVAPPFVLLEQMITLRIHIDDVTAENAPLRIALGSHRLGPVAVHQVANVVARSRQSVCLARAGDVWAYATPILHASDSAQVPTGRRVLHVDYAVGDLPHGLRWLGL